MAEETKPAGELDVHIEESDRARLCHLEEQLKQLLEALMSVADMVSDTETSSPRLWIYYDEEICLMIR